MMPVVRSCLLFSICFFIFACGSSSTTSTSSTTTSTASAWDVVTSSGTVIDGTDFIGTDQSGLIATGGVTQGSSSGDFDIAIVDSDTTNGWAVGSLGEVLKSTDSGTTSTRLDFSTLSASRLRAVAPVTTTHVWIGGQDSVNLGASIWVTTTGGTSWSSQFNTVTAFPNRSLTTLDRVNSLFFFDENTGYAAGGYSGNVSFILKTTNSGSTWTTVYDTQTTGTNDEINRIFFADTSNGYAVGNRAAILETTDGGTTWTNISSTFTCPNSDPDSCDLHEVSCSDVNTCYIGGEGGLIAKTTDAAATWTVLTTGTTEDISALDVRSEKIWAGGFNGTILYSENSGTTWTAQTSNTTYIVQKIEMVSDLVGYAACGNTATNTGAILKTTTGGK